MHLSKLSALKNFLITKLVSFAKAILFVLIYSTSLKANKNWLVEV